MDSASHDPAAAGPALPDPVTTDLAIVIVSWNVWDLLRACLHSIEQESQATEDPRVRRFGPQGQATLQVLVVDNASQDHTRDLLPKLFPWVGFLPQESNLGFTAANNRALRALGFGDRGTSPLPASPLPRLAELATPSPLHEWGGEGESHASGWGRGEVRKGEAPDLVLFLNPDTELLPGSLWTLYQAMAQDEGIGVVGPQLRYGDGRVQSSRRRFPTRLTGFFESTWLGRRWPDNPWRRRYHLADWPATFRQDVDWLVGAAFLVRGVALAQVGLFDEGFFMYSEELDLCRRIKAAGWRVVYEPAAVVIHYEGRSSEQAVAARDRHFHSSKVRYYRKVFGPAWAELLRRYLLLEFRLQILLEGAKLLLGHKRSLRRARIQAYREVLASRLQPEA